MKDISFRPPAGGDYIKVHNFVLRCENLENYPLHLYRIIFNYFPDTCLIAFSGGEVKGFISGFFSQAEKDKYFLWQIGVGGSCRGRGVAGKLLGKLEKKLKESGCGIIEVTVDPVNLPSRKLFEKNGYANASPQAGEIIEKAGAECVADYYGPGRHFIVFRKKI